MADPLIDRLKKYSAEPEFVWEELEREFALAGRQERIAHLLNFDRYFEENGLRVSRADAQLVRQYRDLKSIHDTLNKAGR